MKMPPKLVAGETLNYITEPRVASTYPASAGWVVTLYLNARAAGTATTVSSTASGDDHVLEVAATVTAGWGAGWYGWEIWASLGLERYRIDDGQLQVVAGLLSAAAGADTRSLAQRALDDAEAALAAWTPTTKRYKIGEREMEFNDQGDIIALISHWRAAVTREQAAQSMAAGRPNPRKLQVRMGRA
jgi:hypothetical protein